MYGWWNNNRTFVNVQPFVLPSNAPTRIAPAGRKRNAIVYAKKGSVASHAGEKRLRPDVLSGRSASDAASVVMAGYPTFDGHSAAIFAFAAVNWPRLANFALA